MRRILSGLFFCLAATTGFGATIAVIDTGIDYKHIDLKHNIWNNPVCPQDVVAGGKTYPSAINGWNFAEKNNEVIDYKYLGKFSPDCTKAFEVQVKIQLGVATVEEREWFKQKKTDPAFMTEMATFGNFVHGTHVAGIAGKDSARAKLIGVKIIATERPTARFLAQFRARLGNRPADDATVKAFLLTLAKRQAESLAEAGAFTAATRARVANGSFGVSVAAVKPTIAAIVKQLLGAAPSEADKTEYAKFLIREVVSASSTFPASSPKTLFVLASGNEGNDNSVLPVTPANIRADNIITVAATNGTAAWVNFSNYSATLVEVGAPGLAIDSTVPGDKRLQMSGTSMAAPFVANIAGAVFDENPALTPAEVKKILMRTVDVKPFLKGKVSTSGIVNKKRAVLAAYLSLGLPLDLAVSQARRDVADQAEVRSVPESAVAELLVLPLPSPL